MAACFALASLLAAAQVPEPPPAAALQWTAPRECPDAAALQTRISRRLGRPLADGEATLEARVLRLGTRGYTLHLRLAAGERRELREVTDASCAALADLVALLVAAAVEPAPAAVDSSGGPEPETVVPVVEEAVVGEAAGTGFELGAGVGRLDGPVEVGPAPVEVGPAPDGAAAGPPDRAGRPGGFLRLYGGGELGAVPGATGGLGLAGGLLGRRWRVLLRGTWLAPRTVARAAGELEAGLLAGAVQGCGRLGRGVIELPLCAGLEAGAMRGRASATAVAGWVAALLGPALVWHAGRRWGVWVGVELALAVLRPRFELGAGARAVALFRPSLASGRLLAGVELRLGDPW